MASVKVSMTRAIIGISVLQSVCVLVVYVVMVFMIVYRLAPEGTALAPAEGLLATGASLDGDGMLAAGALPLAPLAAALCPGVPLMLAVLLITPLLPEPMLLASLLAFLSSTFLQAAVPNANAAAASATAK
ncbi:hypothetical protein VSR68_05470 [Paraburkholderia phymatum]|uniref:hypothetical protein n=1 Tax=Paraburkholderia phymatum TaxID=148447 RepID=UPI00316CAF56